MAHHYAFAMKVAAKQEPEKPSLHHRLEGENRLNCTRTKPRNEDSMNTVAIASVKLARVATLK